MPLSRESSRPRLRSIIIALEDEEEEEEEEEEEVRNSTTPRPLAPVLRCIALHRAAQSMPAKAQQQQQQDGWLRNS